MTPNNKPILHYGFCIDYDSHPPKEAKLDEVGCVSQEGFKTLDLALKAIQDQDLIVDYKDTILFFGMNSENIMVVLHPMGYMTGEDFLNSP